MMVTNKSKSAYVYTVLNRLDIFTIQHVLVMNAITLLLTFFEIRIMPEKTIFDKKTIYNISALH